MVTIKEIYNELVEAASPSAVAYFPGSFKPPHKGHFNAVKSLASRPFVTQVVVIIGQKEKNGINANMSKDIWNIYLKAQPNPKVKVRIASDASPVKDIFDILDKDLNKIAYVAATMSDPDDQGYVESLTKAFGDRVKPLNVEEQTLVNGQVLTSDQILALVGELKQYDSQLKTADKGTTIYSKARNGYLNTLNKLKACFPESVIQKGLFDDVVRILGVDLFSPDELQENIFSIGWWSDVLKEEEYKLDVKPTVKAKDVDPKELKKGIAVEKEHTTDLKTAKRIALNHLGEDPKYYTKLAKAKLEEEQNGNLDSINDFIKFAVDTLELQQVPKITFTDDEELAKQMHSLGMYKPQTDELLVVRGNRMIADVLRTLAHELVHRKQNELGQLEPGSGATGSPVENEANAAAGVLLRLYGAKNTDIYEAIKLNEVGEISNPFDWKYDFADDDGNYFYSFNSPQNKYSVGISWSGDDSYEVLFNTEGEMGQDTGEGVAMRVLSTVTAITLDFIDRIDPEEVILRPIQTKKAGDKVDTRRFNVYGAYLRKNLPSGYKLITLGDTYRMIKNR
jgi:ribosome-binding factor A